MLKLKRQVLKQWALKTRGKNQIKPKVNNAGLELKYLNNEIKDKHERFYKSWKEILEYSNDLDLGLWNSLLMFFHIP